MTTKSPQRPRTPTAQRRASKPRPLGLYARYVALFGGVTLVAVAWLLMLTGWGAR